MEIVKLSDVISLMRDVEFKATLYGAEQNAISEYKELCLDVGRAIMEENGIKENFLALTLSEDTILGEESLKKYKKLKAWFEKSIK